MERDLRWNELEDRRTARLDAGFRQHAGQAVDSKEIEDSARAVYELASAMAKNYRNHPDAWSFLSNATIDAELAPIYLEIRSLSEKHFTFEDILLDDKPVTPYSRMQYLFREDDPEKRHDILSRVARGHPEVDAATSRLYAKRRELATAWDYTPLDDVLRSEGLTAEQLRRLVVHMATAMRPAFDVHFVEIREAVLGDNCGEPWEDFVTLYMNRWSVHTDRIIPQVDGVAGVRRAARQMSFSIDAITMDLEDRPHKNPVPTAWDVQVPGDVRVSIKPSGGAENLSSLYHEMGHALHFVTIDATLPLYTRLGWSTGVAETFSFWMESLLSEASYLDELGFDLEAAAAMIRFEQMVRAIFVPWLAAQVLSMIDFWTGGPFTLESLGENFSQYLHQTMGLEAPAAALRAFPAFVRGADIYPVGYLIAYVRLAHLLNELEAVDHAWWRSAAAVDVVRQYMKGGRDAGFPSSMFDVNPFIQRFVPSA